MEIDIKRIAKLSRLEISQDEIPKIAKNMENIIHLVENMPSFDSEELKLDENNPMILRSDEVAPSFNREELLKNAPELSMGCIVVPKIIE